MSTYSRKIRLHTQHTDLSISIGSHRQTADTNSHGWSRPNTLPWRIGVFDVGRLQYCPQIIFFLSSSSLLSLTIVLQCQSYNCCVKFLVYISVRFTVVVIHTHKTVLASLSSHRKQALIEACFVNPLTFHP